MKEEFRVERNGLKRWSRPPEGYVRLDASELVQPGDVQRISDELYAEYPAKGLLKGCLLGTSGERAVDGIASLPLNRKMAMCKLLSQCWLLRTREITVTWETSDRPYTSSGPRKTGNFAIKGFLRALVWGRLFCFVWPRGAVSLDW